MKPTWHAIYPFSQGGHIFNNHKKRAVTQDDKNEDTETSEQARHELADILKDEDPDEGDSKDVDIQKSDEKNEKAVSKHKKTKRQSSEDEEKLPEIGAITETAEGEQEEPAPNPPDFQVNSCAFKIFTSLFMYYYLKSDHLLFLIDTFTIRVDINRLNIQSYEI